MSDMERRLLGRLLSAEAIAEAWECGVRPEQFVEPLYQAVYNFTISYWQASRMNAAPTAWVLGQEFSGYVPAEAIEEEVFELAALLRRRYATNQLQDMMRRATTNSVLDPEGTLKELYAQAFAASEIITPRLTRINMADTVEARRDRYNRNAEAPQGRGVTYGIDLLDAYTGGLRAGELAVVGAYAKTGKTHFLCNAAVAALRAGYRPLIYSLEVSLTDMQERIDAFYSGLSYDRITRCSLSLGDKQRLWDAHDELTAQGGLAIERPDPGDRTVIALVTRAHQLGANYLLIDQLSRLEPGQKTFSTKETRAVVMAQLSTEISRAGTEIPCVLAAQTKRGEGEPNLESFADAAEIEREVDIALVLWRNRDLYNHSQMKVEIVGSRRSGATAFLCDWDLVNRTRIAGREEIRA